MTIDNKTVYFLGKLAAFNRRDATELVRKKGGRVAKTLTANVQFVVVGEGDILAQDWNLWNDQLDAATRAAFEAGELEIIAEAVFWQRYLDESADLPEGLKSLSTLYTPAMLAELTGLSIALIRRLERQRIIVAAKQVHRLSYFDHESILTARIIRSIMETGLSENKAMSYVTRVRHHFTQDPVNLQLSGKDLIFVTKKGPIDRIGQRCFDFIAEPENTPVSNEEPAPVEPMAILEKLFQPSAETLGQEELCQAAWEFESEGNLDSALDLYHAALAAGPPQPMIHFQIAEILYRQGELTAARERYYSAVELDEEFVEARANLGCVLAQLGADELAAAAFRGALKFHPDYAEVRFHLGKLLCRVGLQEEGVEQLKRFLELAPDSPWAEQVLQDLSEME